MADELNELNEVAEHVDKAALNLSKDVVSTTYERIINMKELFGSKEANVEKLSDLSEYMSGDKVVLDMSGVSALSPEVVEQLSDVTKNSAEVSFRNYEVDSDTWLNLAVNKEIADSDVHGSLFTDFKTQTIDLNAFMGGEESIDSRESIQNLRNYINNLKNDEFDESDRIVIDFSRIKHISFEAAEELSVIVGNDETIKFFGFTHDKIDMEKSESITSKIEPDKNRGLSPEEDVAFLNEIKNADKLSYAQSRMLAIVHPELIDQYSEKFDWKNASICVAKYCPEAVLTNSEKFNYWQASDMLLSTNAEIADKVKDKLELGKDRAIRMNEDIHPDQIKMMVEKGEKLGLSAVCVERLKSAYNSKESLSGQKFLEILSKDLFRAENFNLQRVPVDNDIVKAMAVIGEAGLTVDERSINKIRINENQYMKIPTHELGFSDIKSQLPSLLRGERTSLMHSVDDNGVMKDYKLQIGFNPDGNLQVKKLGKLDKLQKPNGMSEEDWKQLCDGTVGVVQSHDPIEGLTNGFAAGRALADLLFNYSIDEELNRVIATVDIPYNTIKENQNINALQSLNEGIEQQVREKKKNQEKIENDNSQKVGEETIETKEFTITNGESSDVDIRLAAAEKEVARLANETISESSAEAEARMHMDLGRLEELHDKEYNALGHGEQKLNNVRAEKNSQKNKVSERKITKQKIKVG